MRETTATGGIEDFQTGTKRSQARSDMKMTDTKHPISNSGQGDRSNGVQSDSPVPAKSTSSSGKIELWIVLGIFFLALCVRYFYLYESSANPTFEAPISDSQTYHGLASRLAEGQGMTREFFWQALFYPLYLAVVYYFSDLSIFCVKNVQVILGCFTCVLTYFLAKRIFGRRSGILAAVMVSLYGPLIFFETELLAAGWASFWSVVLILLFLKARDTKGLLVCFVLGVCGALSIITRPTFLLFFTAGCLWLVFIFYRASMSNQSFLLRPVTILAGFALIAVPVAAQCYHLTKHFGILPSSGGLNLYIGNNPNAAETIIIRPGADWGELTRLPRSEGMGGKNRWERQRFFFQEVREYMLSQPLDFAKGLARKALRFFTSREMPRNVDIYLFRRWSGLLTFLMWKVGGFGFPFGLLLPMAIAGLFFRWRQIPVPVILFIFLYAASIILVFVSARYRVPMVPVMCCLAAGGIGAIAKMIRLQQSKRLGLAAGCVFAIALLSSLAPLFPEEKVNYEAELHYGLGYFASQSGEFDRAAGHYKTAVQLNPDFDAACNNLGLALARTGELEEAVFYLEKALEIRPEYIKAHGNIATVLLKQGNPNAAIEHLKRALKLAPWEVKLHDTYGRALSELGNLDEAIKHYSVFMRARPNHAGGHYNLAVCLVRQGKINEAIRHFSEVLRIKPDHADARYRMANLLAEQGRSEDALAEYSKTLQINPNHAKAHYKLAVHSARLGKLNEAIRHYSEVLRIKPDHADAHYRLGKAFAQQGRTEEAIECYRQALWLRPDWPEVLNSLAWVYATNENTKLRNGPAAVQLAQRACELTGYKNPNILDTLAAAYAEADSFSDAVRTAEKALDIAVLSGQKELVEKIQHCLGLYKAGKAY